MPRMRTIDQSYEWLKSEDPDTALTKTALRRMVISGQIDSVRVGNKYLLSLDRLEEYLNSSRPEKQLRSAGGIREVRL